MVFAFVCSKNACAQSDSLEEVRVISTLKLSSTRETVPAFQLSKKQIENLSSNSIAEALQYIPGILVKDYGGIGGLKTISVRSLGAAHNTIFYNGLPLMNSQNSSIDLGKISIENIDKINFYQSQPVNILLPAKAFSSGSITEIKTAGFDSTIKTKSVFGFTAGSFNTLGFMVAGKYLITKKLQLNVLAQTINSRGNYYFDSYEVGGKKQRRINSDVKSQQLEIDLSTANEMNFKLFFYHSERGIPGSVILYNSISRQRSDDIIFFIQGFKKLNISTKDQILLSGKLGYDITDYTDPDYPNSAGGLRNTFHQQQGYFSIAYTRKVSSKLKFAYASDLGIEKLFRTDVFDANFKDPLRFTYLNNLTTVLNLKNFEFRGNLLSSIYKDKLKGSQGGPSVSRITPAFSAIYNIGRASIRFFYKDIFRVPNFNDLYFTNVGNANLKPENVKSYNLGFTLNHTSSGIINNVEFSADAFINNVTDKIVAVPRQNLFQWTMLNIGKAEIKGIDNGLRLRFKRINSLDINLMASYSFQQAIDKSDKSSSLYNTQLPYVPMHSGSAGILLTMKKLSVGYNLLFSGNRYRLGTPSRENLVEGFGIQDIFLGYSLTVKRAESKIQFSINNIANKNYEVVRYYPMPGINFRLRLTVSI
ncbi:MAG: TonB-dependent receptor [Bacteroidetes bacterium]|nr:TonB-dependent receptor [Bacteroidota bacterium]